MTPAWCLVSPLEARARAVAARMSIRSHRTSNRCRFYEHRRRVLDQALCQTPAWTPANAPCATPASTGGDLNLQGARILAGPGITVQDPSSSSTSSNLNVTACDSFSTQHLLVRSVGAKRRTPTRCLPRPARPPRSGGLRVDCAQDERAPPARYRMLIRALSDRQNSAFRKAP